MPAGRYLVNICVFSQFWCSVQREYPIDLKCSGNHSATVIVEVDTILIHKFDYNVLLRDVRL